MTLVTDMIAGENEAIKGRQEGYDLGFEEVGFVVCCRLGGEGVLAVCWMTVNVDAFAGLVSFVMDLTHVAEL